MKFLLGLLIVIAMLVTVDLGLIVEDKIHSIRQRGLLGLWIASQPKASVSEKSKPKERFVSPTLWVPAPEDHPPFKITTGLFIYEVKYAPFAYFLDNRCVAFTDKRNHWIVLNRQRSTVEVREDLLHELMHGAVENAREEGYSYVERKEDQNPEDALIGPMAPVLRDILVDNPLLVKWLLKAGG